jgi:rSAM/selenodomain-associated transferase 1
VSPRRERVIVVFAKEPRSGQVKTRMSPPLSLEQAAELYAELLADVLRATAAFSRELGLQPVLAVHPVEACPRLARGAPAAFRVVPQRGEGLAARMQRAVDEAGAAGASRILLRGSDSPVLDGESAGAALAALSDADLVLCPDRDGGYGLVGLRRPVRGLFEHPMSTGTVLDDTLANADALGLRSQVLDPSFDLDTTSDLRWLAEARDERVARLCPRTLAYLDAHDLWRFAGA